MKKKPIPLTPYQRKLLLFLSVASFFEGYDFLALAQLLPNLRAAFGLSKFEGGLLVGVVNAGTIVAYILVRKADVWGRRSVLSLTIAGYALASLLSGFAPNAWAFGILQLIARVFLIGEWAVSMVIAAEEFPADRRGLSLGTIQVASSLGAIACAGLVPMLVATPLGWRSVYFVGSVPLVLLAVARRGMRETRRYAEQGQPAHRGLFELMRGPLRTRTLWVALTWGLAYVCTQNAVTFWKEFAVHERGLSDAQVGTSVAIAAVAAMPLAFGSGVLLDVIGRRVGACLIFVATSVGVVLAYTLTSQWTLTGGLIVAIFGTTAILQVLNTYTTELFPTESRADAFAWSNNLLGRIGYVLSPLLVGHAAESMGWGRAVSATAAFPLLALLVILAKFPETKGKELEETSRIDSNGS